MESDSTKATIGTAAALSIRLPQFWAHSPKLWFSQAEAHFALRQVSSSQTKFYYAIAALPDHIASGVDDLLDPEPPNPYEALKAKLLRRFGETQDQRLQKLLHWSPPPIKSLHSGCARCVGCSTIEASKKGLFFVCCFWIGCRSTFNFCSKPAP
ncbi:hypothetical protein M514_11642 [Trichuris suis]|uniref:DUF7041 domain-containing protein n=1 Tax=Trichuris suis TaxID=68888 RepID=A0A085MUW4_9BILA|nr:hypothetical protein M514_11642 [Trichuris suis]